MQWLRLPWFLILPLVAEGAAHLLRQPPLTKDVGKVGERIIPTVEIPGQEKKKSREQRTMDAIQAFRAQICSDMHEEHGRKFESYEACKVFMEDACKPGRDGVMDGDRKEVTSEKGYCKEFFPEAVKKAKKQIEEEDMKAAVAVSPGPMPMPMPMPMPAPAPAPAPKVEAPAAAAPAPAVSAPAPGPIGAPGPAPGPVPAPFIPGVSGGKPWGPIGDDEAYYYKDGGKHADRLHMSESMKLPTQGYWGKLVEHEDMKTATDDWGKEFGTKSGYRSFQKYCMTHHRNRWCMEHGFGERSNSFSAVLSTSLLLAVLVKVLL